MRIYSTLKCFKINIVFLLFFNAELVCSEGYNTIENFESSHFFSVKDLQIELKIEKEPSNFLNFNEILRHLSVTNNLFPSEKLLSKRKIIIFLFTDKKSYLDYRQYLNPEVSGLSSKAFYNRSEDTISIYYDQTKPKSKLYSSLVHEFTHALFNNNLTPRWLHGRLGAIC